MLDRFWMWIAWHLPRRLVLWCAVRVVANATVGSYSGQIVPELNAMEALKRWTPTIAALLMLIAAPARAQVASDSLRQYCPEQYLGANSPGDTVVVIPYRYKLSVGQTIYMRAIQCGFGKVREVSKVTGIKWSSSDTSVAKVSRTTGRVTITKDSVRLRNGANVVIKAVYP